MFNGSFCGIWRKERRPPGAIAARQIVDDLGCIPRVASHHARLERFNFARPRSIERNETHFEACGKHGAALVIFVAWLCRAVRTTPFFGVCHPHAQLLRALGAFWHLRQLDAFVLFRIGKARIDGQQRERVAQRSIIGSERAIAPSSVSAAQQTSARGMPVALGRKRAEGREQLSELTERITRDGLAFCRSCQPLLRRLGLDDEIGILAHGAFVVQHIAHGIDFFAHRITKNDHLAAHALRPLIPRLSIERGDTEERQIQTKRDPFCGCRADAHTRERAWATAASHTRKLALGHPCVFERGIDLRDELCVRSAECRRFTRCEHLDRGGFTLELPHANSDDLVGGIEGKYVVLLGHCVSFSLHSGCLAA